MKIHKTIGRKVAMFYISVLPRRGPIPRHPPVRRRLSWDRGRNAGEKGQTGHEGKGPQEKVYEEDKTGQRRYVLAVKEHKVPPR